MAPFTTGALTGGPLLCEDNPLAPGIGGPRAGGPAIGFTGGPPKLGGPLGLGAGGPFGLTSGGLPMFGAGGPRLPFSKGLGGPEGRGPPPGTKGGPGGPM